MEFKGQYLTYEEYLELKGTLDQVSFNLLEYDVRKMIDKRTLNRLKNISEIPEEVKGCVYKMITIKESYQSLRKQDKTIVSTNTDGYSETKKKLEISDIETEDRELCNVMETYLHGVIVNNTPILYLGVE